MLSGLALYIHWPFCKSKCPYCSFNSYVRDDINQEDWLKAYIEELKHYHDLFGDREISSIYFGGGTPSLMAIPTVKGILETISKLWGIDKGTEITIEVNPTSFETGKFLNFKLAGINRLSIGIQSLTDEGLKYLGREHSVEDAINTLNSASEIFDRYSFDLIYARNNEHSLSAWEDELTEAIKYSKGHMSLYQLSLDEGSKFYSWYEKGELEQVNEDLSADMYEITQEIMDKHNLPAYEVSNHATPGQESKHNLIYWNYGDYIGIGAGAHGRITADGKKVAISNVKVPEQWKERVTSPVSEEVGREGELKEELLMGLRLVSGIKWKDDFLEVIDKEKMSILIAENIIMLDNGIIKVTKEGMQKLNSVLEYIL